MLTGFFIHGGVLPDYGWQVLFLFLGLLVGWSTVGLVAPSLFGIVVLAFTEGFAINTAWSTGFGGNLVSLIILFSVFAKWLENIGLTAVIMNWFMSRKFMQGRPWVFVMVFFLMVYLMGFLVGAIPAILMVWAFAYLLLEEVGFEKCSPFMGFLIANIVVITGQGSYCRPWGPWGLTAIQSYQTVVPDGSIDFLLFMVWTTIVFLVSDVLMVLVGKYILKLDVSPLINYDYSKLATDKKMNFQQKLASVLLIVMMIILFIPTYLPDGAFKTGLKTMDVLGTIIVTLVVASMIKNPEGKPYFSFNDVVNVKGTIPWGAVMLITATVPLGNALRAKEAGIMPLITSFAKTHMADLSPFLFYCLVAIVLGLLTQVAHNLVLLAAVSPIFATVALSIGASAEVIMMISTVVLCTALGTPAASTRAGMLFGNSQYITVGDCYKYGWLSLATCLIATLFIGVPILSVIG
jgi:sodium-dependent dicarboxylate transporter 2/3/5